MGATADDHHVWQLSEELSQASGDVDTMAGYCEMKRADFDAAMAVGDVAVLIENTFLARVPALVAGGMTVEDAVIAAKEQEDRLCLLMIAPGWQRDAVEELKRRITERVYEKCRALPPPPSAINPRWLECEAALGHRPTAHEFIMWHRTHPTPAREG